MRKLHLLQAEWRDANKRADARAYKLMAAWCGKNTPEAGEVFPSLEEPEVEDSLVDVDDRVLFAHSAAAMGAR